MKRPKRIQIVVDVEIDNDSERKINGNTEEIKETINKLRQSIIEASLAKNSIQEKYDYSLSEIARWQRRAELAVFAKNDYLAKEALLRKGYFKKNAAELKVQMKLDQNISIISSLRQKLNVLEMKIVDIGIIDPNYSNFTEVQKFMPESMSDISCISVMTTFERLEEKIKQIEAESELAAKLGGGNLQQEFASLNASAYISDDVIDAELDELRAQLDD